MQDHMTQINPRAEERVTLKTGNGKWCYKLDENRIAYARITTINISTFNWNLSWSLDLGNDQGTSLNIVGNWKRAKEDAWL